MAQSLIPPRERGSFMAAGEIEIGGEKVQLKPLGDKRLSDN